MPYPTIPCPNPTLPYLPTLPFPTLPYLTVPYRIVPNPTVLYPTLPYPYPNTNPNLEPTTQTLPTKPHPTHNPYPYTHPTLLYPTQPLSYACPAIHRLARPYPTLPFRCICRSVQISFGSSVVHFGI